MTSLDRPLPPALAEILASPHPASFDIVADKVEGVPIDEIERLLRARGIPYHRTPLKLHYRSAGELPHLVIEG